MEKQAQDKSKKNKGDGINAILTLMKDLRDFQDKVETCIDAQAIAENKQKVEQFYDLLDNMAEVLLDIAESGIKSSRKVEKIDSIRETPVNIEMVNAPTIPRLDI